MTAAVMTDSAFIAEIIAELNAGRDEGEHLSVLIGERYLGENATPPRVVWVPTRDTFGPPMPGVGTEGTKQVMTVWAEYDVHCWGASIDEARELMLEVLLAGYHNTGRTYFSAPGSTWLTDGQIANNGVVAVLNVKMALGVADRPSTLARVIVVKGDVRTSDTEPEAVEIELEL